MVLFEGIHTYHRCSKLFVNKENSLAMMFSSDILTSENHKGRKMIVYLNITRQNFIEKLHRQVNKIFMIFNQNTKFKIYYL